MLGWTDVVFLVVPAPAPVITKDGSSHSTDKSNDPPPYCSLFDLTKRVPESVLDDASLTLIDPSLETDDDHKDQYDDLLQKIRTVIVDGNFRYIVEGSESSWQLG